jgi:succinylglutamate desuccinylase
VIDGAKLLEEPRAERQELRWISLGMKKLFVEPRNKKQDNEITRARELESKNKE